ncbi:MAG: carbohydrate-binding family 9-like protein, partial [Bacteroidales bacterium]|nr:carbohydrate-binding family 9-like protein [Bacteroidales bacterium]
MKRFALILALLLPAFVFADTTPRIYDAQRTKEAIKIDGKLTESSWNTVKYSDDFADIRGMDWPAPTMKTNVKMLWDNECLYIGARLEEKNITGDITGRDEIIWKNNDFEVFIDPYSDGKLYYEIENNALGTVMDLLMDKPYSEGGVFIMNWDCKGLQLAVSYDGTLNNPKDTDKAWYVEMAIPFAALQRDFKDPRASKVWRINFSRVEWLVKGGPEENWVWSPTGKVDMHMPAKWGYLRFCDGNVIPPMPPAKVVKNWMWERIKEKWSDEQYAAHFK